MGAVPKGLKQKLFDAPVLIRIYIIRGKHKGIPLLPRHPFLAAPEPPGKHGGGPRRNFLQGLRCQAGLQQMDAERCKTNNDRRRFGVNEAAQDRRQHIFRDERSSLYVQYKKPAL